jgi:hypothetical protein
MNKVKEHGKCTKFPTFIITIDLALQGLLTAVGLLLDGVLVLVAKL